MKKRFLALTMGCILAASMAVTGCGKKSSTNTGGNTGEAAAGSDYTELYASEVSTMNYLVTSTVEEQKIGANCIDTLIEYDSKGQIKEGLATEWSYDEASMTWTFKLRDAKWVDTTGAEVTDVTAQDFVDAMKYMLTPEYESANVQNLFGIIKNAREYYNGLVYNGGADDAGVVWNPIDFSEVGVKAVDEHTLTYTLDKEVPYFLSSLAYVTYMPAYGPQLEELGKEFGTAADKMYYNGAYYVSQFEPQVTQVLTKNPLNYDAEHVYIENINRIYNSEAQTIGPEMIKRGEVDRAIINADLLDDWMNNPETASMVSKTRPETNTSYFYSFNFNPQFEAEYEPENWKKAVNNENFRKALGAALNKTKEIAVLEPENPEDYEISTITPPNFTFTEDGTDYTTVGELANVTPMYDEAKAVEYKEAAMTELQAQGATFPVKVLMVYNPSIPNWDKECQVVEQQVEGVLGTDFIDIILQAGPTDNFLTEVRRAGKFALMKCNWGADYADPETWVDPFYQPLEENGYGKGYQYGSLATAIEENTESGAVVKEYFELVEAAKAITSDINVRYEAFAKAEAALINHALVIPYSIEVGDYQATRLNVFEAQEAPFGVSRKRFKGMKVQDHYISMEEYKQNEANAK